MQRAIPHRLLWPSDVINRCAAMVSAVLFWTVTSPRFTSRTKLLLLLYLCQWFCGKYWYFMRGKRQDWKKKYEKSYCFVHFLQRIFFFSPFTVIFSQAEQKQDLQWTAHTNTPIHTKTQILLCTKWSVIGWISGDSGFGGSKCFGKTGSRENCGLMWMIAI